MATVSIATSLDSTITLNDGVQMPMFGLGVYEAASGNNGETERSVIHAIQHGYRLVDTAELYNNEADVGRGVRNSGAKREDVFVVSKIWEANGYNYCQKTFRASLKRLGLEYLDLYLIHSPYGTDICGTFRAMLDLQKEGLIRSCGVSNFGIQHLEGMKKAGLPTPSVNQIELHPWGTKVKIVDYCRKNGIAVMGFCPLTRGRKLGDPILNEIAKRHGKSPALVLLRWGVQKGYISIPKSVRPERIEGNTQVFDWSLKEEDVSILDRMPEEVIDWNPTTSPWKG